MNKLTEIKEYIENKFSRTKSFGFFYNSGIDFYKKKNYEKAIEYFKQAIEQEKIKPQVYYNLALTYQLIQDYDRAIINYNKFLESCPKDYDGLYNLALVYSINEKFEKAVELLEKCIEIKKEEDGIKSLTLAYLNNNEIQKAVDFAQNILEKEKNGANLYYKIAKVFENKNSLNKDFTFIDIAIEMYKKLTDKDPSFFDAYLALSICYARKGEFASSVDFCAKALETNPKSYEANNQMGLVYYCCNEVNDAVKYYEEAFKLKPEGDYKVYSNLAYAYEKIGQNDKAIKIFNKLLQKFPDVQIKDEIEKHLECLKKH